MHTKIFYNKKVLYLSKSLASVCLMIIVEGDKKIKLKIPASSGGVEYCSYSAIGFSKERINDRLLLIVLKRFVKAMNLLMDTFKNYKNAQKKISIAIYIKSNRFFGFLKLQQNP